MTKAFILCFYADGLRFAAVLIFSLFSFYIVMLPDIVYLAAVLVVARGMGKDELRSIFAWRRIPVAVFAGILVMFFGLEIVKSELNNLLNIVLPVPGGFFDSRFYTPGSAFFLIVTGSIFPGFTEEVFFRGIIARRFFRSYSLRKSLLLSAALFGIMHFNPWQAVNAFYMGIFLGWIYWRYRSIWLCMFIHAYHNTLADFISFPYIEIGVNNQMWRHPVWFDIMGLLLFGLGLLTVIVLSRKERQ
jgi:membrane protease YdiL (CAAX protease family)